MRSKIENLIDDIKFAFPAYVNVMYKIFIMHF